MCLSVCIDGCADGLIGPIGWWQCVYHCRSVGLWIPWLKLQNSFLSFAFLHISTHHRVGQMTAITALTALSKAGNNLGGAPMPQPLIVTVLILAAVIPKPSN